ncbi:hypothetical protein ACKGJI_06425 [Sulfurospirillum sp. 1307]|jgi:hypothetical protein
MSSSIFSREDLVSLVDHHIALLDRFGLKDEAPFSIIYFSMKDKDIADSTEIFGKILRKTDALIQIDNFFIVMLPGTDWNGASELLSGIQEFLSQEAMDNIVTYPEDGIDAKSMLKRLENIVEDNSGDIVKLV